MRTWLRTNAKATKPMHKPSQQKKVPQPEHVIVKRLWWGEVDSNHRSRGRQIYSLLPLAARESPQIFR